MTSNDIYYYLKIKDHFYISKFDFDDIDEEKFDNLIHTSLKKIKYKKIKDLYNIVINKYDYIDGEIINIKKRKFDDRN